MTGRTSLRSEAGLVGKSVVVLMFVVLLAGLAVVETASIVFTYVSLDGAANEAAKESATTYASTHNQRAACAMGKQVMLQRDQDAKFVDRLCRVNSDGSVTVTVRKEAPTLVVRHVGALDQLGVVTETVTAGPPSL
jgi:hypothetical protein